MQSRVLGMGNFVPRFRFTCHCSVVGWVIISRRTAAVCAERRVPGGGGAGARAAPIARVTLGGPPQVGPPYRIPEQSNNRLHPVRRLLIFVSVSMLGSTGSINCKSSIFSRLLDFCYEDFCFEDTLKTGWLDGCAWTLDLGRGLVPNIIYVLLI